METEVVVRGNEVLLLDETETVNLQKAVGYVAISLYKKFVEYSHLEKRDADYKKELESEMRFQSEILDSLSNACLSVAKREIISQKKKG